MWDGNASVGAMSDRFYTGCSCKGSLLQSWNRAQLKAILEVLLPASYFYHHINNTEASTVNQYSHRFCHLPCECFVRSIVVFWRFVFIKFAASLLYLLSPWRQFSLSTARTSKFSHLLRLADHFWWCLVPDGVLLLAWSKATLGWQMHEFCISAWTYCSSSSFLFFPSSISRRLPQPGPITGGECLDSYVCVRVVWRTAAAGVDDNSTSKI